MSNAKFLYLPIEVASRELDARILLSIRAAAQGTTVLIGQQWLMMWNLEKFRPGVVFFKGVNKMQFSWMRRAKRAGHKTVAIDEEVTAISNDRFVLKEVHESLFPHVDKIFMQGPFQNETISTRYPDVTPKLSVTGNARWDMLRPQFRNFHDADVAAIRKQHGRFILVNTNFGYVNSFWGGPEGFERVCERVGYIERGNAFDEDWLAKQYEFEARNAEAFVGMIRALSDRYPEHKIILRPHPSESFEFWDERLLAIPRTQVIGGGSAVAWILASDFLVHNGCTTGIEAFLLDCPVGAFSPFTNWAEDVLLGNKVTTRHTAYKTLFEDIDAAIADREAFVALSRDRNVETLRKHYDGFEGRSATNRIYDEIDPLLAHSDNPDFFVDGADAVEEVPASVTSLPAAEIRKKKVDLNLKGLTTRYMNLMSAIGVKVPSSIRPIGESLFLIQPKS